MRRPYTPPMRTVIDWLLEPDAENPGVRYFALQQLLDRTPDDPDVCVAREEVMRTGPVPAILAAQQPEGYWEKPGPGYATKYRGTVWQLILLGELGADGSHPRVRAACDYVLAHSQTESGGFGASGSHLTRRPPPSSALHCLNGNLLHALIRLGRLSDPGVRDAVAWETKAITGSDPDFTYYRSGTSGPVFGCAANAQQPCGWGAAKALRALAAIPPAARDAETDHALAIGAQFLLSRDPAVADYPSSGNVSGTWFRFGFPMSYWSDVLEVTEVLVDLGFGADARLDHAFAFILGKRGATGLWPLENTLNGKTWSGIEAKGKPSKWVTLRAVRTLRKAGRLPQDIAAELASYPPG